MRHTVKLAALAAVAALALAGCGGGAPTKAAATKDAVHYATNQQYGSLVAGASRQLGQDMAYEMGPSCSLMVPGHDGAGVDSITCGSKVTVIELEASAFASTLADANRKASKSYIGPPSPQLAPLVAGTLAAARALSEEPNRLADTCVLSGGSGCLTLVVSASNDISTMQDRLASWKPYES